MTDWNDFARRARRRLAALIDPEEILPHADAYYPQQPSCQIPTLYFLLETFLGKRESGYFVEVGAFDGKTFSNTWGLAVRHWRGLLIEPVPEFAQACRRSHAGHPNITVAEVAVGPPNADEIDLHFAGPLTTANQLLLEEYRDIPWAKDSISKGTVTVRLTTLNKLLAENEVPHNFDLLSVDCEGFEYEVFSGIDLSVYRPKIVIVELTDLHPDLSTTALDDGRLCLRICQAGWVIAYKDAINTVFVRSDIWHETYPQEQGSPGSGESIDEPRYPPR